MGKIGEKTEIFRDTSGVGSPILLHPVTIWIQSVEGRCENVLMNK